MLAVMNTTNHSHYIYYIHTVYKKLNKISNILIIVYFYIMCTIYTIAILKIKFKLKLFYTLEEEC